MPRKSKKYHSDGELVEGQKRIVLENQHKTVDEILGRQVLSNYEQKTESAYAAFLDDLSDLDLQKEAVRVGIFPKDRRDWNIEKLKELYHQQVVKAELQEMKPINTNRKLTRAQQEALDKGKNSLT